jgi:hypothetical protein
MIICLAGRRVDAARAKEARFSGTPENLRLVRNRIRQALIHHGAKIVVSSAACGADLLALTEAGSLKLRRCVILPFAREKFRETSVIDRPGDWGALYDQVLDEVEKDEGLVVIAAGSDDEAYAKTNHAIVDQALALGEQHQQPVTAMLVWDKKSRGSGDLTEEFAAYARSQGIPIVEVATI